MHRSRRVINLLLAVFLAAALLAPAALAAPPTTTDDAGSAGWWSWVTTQVVHVVNALGPGWEPDGQEGDSAGGTSGAGGESLETTDPDLEDENNLGPGWEPEG